MHCRAALQPAASAAPQQRRQQQCQQPAPLQHERPPPQQEHRRRMLIGGLLGLASAAALPSPAAAAAAAAALAEEAPLAGPAPGSLAAKLATSGAVRQPGIQPPWAPKQTYYPRWLFGEWTVDMQFTGVSTPLGKKYVPDGFLQAAEAAPEAGGVGSRYSFRQRWYSTLPPTWDNTLRVNLGLGMPQDAIIADRAFNTRETTNAFLGYPAVASVEYDPTDAPLRQTVELSRLAPDLAPLPPRRLELYINALSQEEGEGGAFRTSELCRQVLLGVRQAEVKDYEIIHEYRLLGPGRVEGRQRSCLYLQPQEPNFFAAGGRSVAVYDYTFTMTRVPPPEDAVSMGAVACVLTPKAVTQCV